MSVLGTLVRSRLLAVLVVLAAAAVAAIAFLVPAPEPVTAETSTGLPDSYQSSLVEKALADLPSSGIEPAVVVVSRPAADGTLQPLSEADLAATAQAGSQLSGYAVDGRVPPPQVSDDGTVALIVVPLDTAAAEGEDDTVADERTIRTVKDIRGDVADLPGGLRAQVTGGPAFFTDIDSAFDGADVTLLLSTAAVVALLLFLTYRSPLLVVVPLVVVAVADTTVGRLNDLVLPFVGLPNDPANSGITSVLVFGAATDYTLLLAARYREQLRRVERPRDAMVAALRGTAPAILASGGTVVLAVLTLLLAVVQSNRTLGVSAAVGIAVAVITGLLVLPCALVPLGRAAFWPFVPRFGSEGREGRIWGALGAGAKRRPWAVVVAGTVVLAALAAAAPAIETGLSQNDQFRVRPQAVDGAETLAAAFPAGTTDPVTVTADAAAADQARSVVQGVAGVVSAEPGDGSAETATITVVLDSEPGSPASGRTIDDLRDALDGVPGAAVGGTPAQSLDLSRAQDRDRAVVIPIILALVGLVLVLLLRAIVAPLLLLATVVATFLASIGAGWVLFRSALFDFPAIDAGIVLLSFVFLVALGVDYNIFLVTRAREEAATTGTRQGMLTALRVTGGVITSAGVLLAAVFVVLGVLPVIALTQIGVIVCIGVLLDTLLVRTLVVPALAFGVGPAFWWPSRVDPAPRGGADPDPGHGTLTPASATAG